MDRWWPLLVFNGFIAPLLITRLDLFYRLYMFVVLIALILLAIWMVANDERRRQKTRSLFIISEPIKAEGKIVNQHVSIQACEEKLLRKTLDTEFIVDGSYKPEPKRTLYYLGVLNNPQTFINEYKAIDMDNFEIKIFNNPKNIPSPTNDGHNLIVFISRAFFEKYGDQNIPMRYLPSTFSLPISSDSIQTYDGKLYKRPLDDDKYLELIYTRNPNKMGDIELSSEIKYMDIKKENVIELS